MEFPNLGQHCSDPQCRRLDFLPVKCDGCTKVFCSEHYPYDSHNCPVAYKKNVQVPVCPLCNTPIPGKPDELPDIRVSRHIDSDCSSDTAVTRRKKVFSNRCSLKGCKQKELVPVLCPTCNMNYCLKHRHPQDHSCESIPAKGRGVSKAGMAALSRIGQTSSNRRSDSSSSRSVVSTSANSNSSLLSRITNSISNSSGRSVSTFQGNISEEDALRMALEASLANDGNSGTNLSNNSTTLSQEQEDFLLAKALAESEMAAAGGEGSSSRRSQQNCEIC